MTFLGAGGGAASFSLSDETLEIEGNERRNMDADGKGAKLTYIAFEPFLRFEPALGVVLAVLEDLSAVNGSSDSEASESSEPLQRPTSEAKRDCSKERTYPAGLRASPLSRESATSSCATSPSTREGSNLEVACSKLYEGDGKEELVQTLRMSRRRSWCTHMWAGGIPSSSLAAAFADKDLC